MTLAPEVEPEIHRLFFAEHWKVGTIALQLNVHHDVVRRIVGALPKRTGSPGGTLTRVSIPTASSSWNNSRSIRACVPHGSTT